MKILKSSVVFFISMILIFAFSHTSAQKNAIMARPLGASLSIFGISYERYLTKNFSAVLYGDYINGPQILWNGINNFVRNGMGNEISGADMRYTGYSIIPELRYYFKNNAKDLPEEIDPEVENKISGWFVGVYVPVRRLKLDFEITSPELYAYAIQRDRGVYSTEATLAGAGIMGGRHWIWGNFSLEMVGGIAFCNGIDKNPTFVFNRNGIGEYKVNKNMGTIGTLLQFQPKFEINLGIAF